MDPVSLGTSLLVSATARHVGRKAQRMVFLNDAVETAARRVAENHAPLEPDIFPVIFRDEQVTELVEEFDADGSVITPVQVADAFKEDMLGAEVEATPEELVTEFLEYLEQEISQQPEIGQKLLMSYSQRIFQYATELREGQQETLFELREVVGQVRAEKGYTVFEPVEERFAQQFAGDHPKERYDLPFYGRDDAIEDIFDFIESDEAVLIVSGASGVGKTRIVVEASLHIQASYPEWRVYTTDIHAGNIDEGLDELDFDEEDGIILVIDDARDAEQLNRLFEIADRHRPDVKLVFTERPYFVQPLENNANRFALRYTVYELPPLDSENVRNILREYYQLTAPPTQDWIIQVSEGRPQIAHLLAEQVLSQDSFKTDPLAESDVLQWVFDDTVRDVTAAADQRGIGNPQKMEDYVRYLAAVGTLDTENLEMKNAFCDAVAIDPADEPRYRAVLTETTGLVDAHGDRLTVQPDALREHIVYDTFFNGAGRDYETQIFDTFGEYTAAEQIRTLLVIRHRYDCRDAGAVVDAVLKEHIAQMSEYGLASRVELLRQFKILGSAKPLWGIELVQTALTADIPETDEPTQLSPRILKAPSPFGNLCLAATAILWNALLREPEAATNLLLEMMVSYAEHSGIKDDIIQKLRQEMEPGLNRDPTSQQRVLSVVSEYIQDDGIDPAIRRELLEIVAAPARSDIHDQFMDPLDDTVVQFRQGPVPVTEARQTLRMDAVDLLINLIRTADATDLEQEAVEKLIGFYRAQIRYFHDVETVYNREELVRICEFATEYVTDGGNLSCVDQFSSLVESDLAADLGIEKCLADLEAQLGNHEQYQTLLHMRPQMRDWDEQETAIRTYLQEIDVDAQHDLFSDIVANYSTGSFARFFALLGEEQPEAAQRLLDTENSALRDYYPNIVSGICAKDPDTGEALIADFIAAEQFDLACAGLRVLINTRRDVAVGHVDHLLAEYQPYPEDLTIYLARILYGQWEDDQAWTETTVMTLLEHTRSLDTATVEAILRVLPCHDEEAIQEIDADIIEALLDYAADRERLSNEAYELSTIVAEAAARSPRPFVEFCLARYNNGYTGVSLLPHYVEIDTDRLQRSEKYSAAVEEITALILDTDQYHPISCSDLLTAFPTTDVADHLVELIPNCDEPQLIQIIEYCKLLVFSDAVERILLAILTDGVDDLRDVDRIRHNILATLSSDPMARVGPMTENQKSKELAAVRRWQDNTELPISVRQFAEEAEQELLEEIDRTAEFLDS